VSVQALLDRCLLNPLWRTINVVCQARILGFPETTVLDELRRKSPKILETAFPEPYLLAETENTIIDDILELLNKHGLTLHQSLNLLERLGRIIEMGQRVAKGTTHGWKLEKPYRLHPEKSRRGLSITILSQTALVPSGS